MKHLILTLIVIVSLTTSLFGCSNESMDYKYTVIVYDNQLDPPEEYQEQFRELLHSGKVQTLEFRDDKPSHITEFPTIIIAKVRIEFQTNSYTELFDFLNID